MYHVKDLSRIKSQQSRYIWIEIRCYKEKAIKSGLWPGWSQLFHLHQLFDLILFRRSPVRGLVERRHQVNDPVRRPPRQNRSRKERRVNSRSWAPFSLSVLLLSEKWGVTVSELPIKPTILAWTFLPAERPMICTSAQSCVFASHEAL